MSNIIFRPIHQHNPTSPPKSNGYLGISPLYYKGKEVTDFTRLLFSVVKNSADKSVEFPIKYNLVNSAIQCVPCEIASRLQGYSCISLSGKINYEVLNV